MRTLLRPCGFYIRGAIMIEAHPQFCQMRRYGWFWGRCLAFAWSKAREQRGRMTAARYGAMLAARGIRGRCDDRLFEDRPSHKDPRATLAIPHAVRTPGKTRRC